MTQLQVSELEISECVRSLQSFEVHIWQAIHRRLLLQET